VTTINALPKPSLGVPLGVHYSFSLSNARSFDRNDMGRSAAMLRDGVTGVM
jgi:hypothetical protein